VTAATKRFRDCVWLLIAQAIGAFNDNATKIMLPALALILWKDEVMSWVNLGVSLMLIIPFILFGPFAGWMADRFSKRKITSMALLAQVFGLLVLFLGMFLCLKMGGKWFSVCLVGFFLLAVQSAML
ncbi:uncharacterized protein METZ01_LOCUS252144, partial [marine metagenome]